MVRSVGRWSAGTKTESSTHQAYCDLIQDSKHFIYIENQFFCSGLEGRAKKPKKSKCKSPIRVVSVVSICFHRIRQLMTALEHRPHPGARG